MPTFQTKVGPNRTLALPNELCDRLGIEEGTTVEFFLTLDGQVHFHALTQAAGEFGGFNIDRRRPPLSVREMDDGIAEHVTNKFLRLNRADDEDAIESTRRPAAE